jgi:CRP/FNR family transcriptional regulator
MEDIMELHGDTAARTILLRPLGRPGIAPAPRELRATLPAAPCETCNVRRLCLPGGLDERSKPLLDGLLIGRRRLRKGQKLFRAGDPFLSLYAVRFGTFKTSLPLPDGGEHVSAFHLPGDIMGFDGAADGRHRTTTTALESAEACPIPFAQLMEACAGSADLRKRVAQLMGAQLVREYRTTQLVARHLSEARVAGFLLLVSGWMRERGYSPLEFHLRMSRAEIGSYLGTSLETVSRALSLFARRGFIRVHSRQIELVDEEGLRAFEAGDQRAPV